MTDVSRAMQMPPPGAQQQPAPAAPSPAAPDAKREAKNERDRQRRAAKRAADAKAAKLAAAKPKKKKAKKKTKRATLAEKIDAAYQTAGVRAPKKRKRGRPPGSKNKTPKVGLSAALAPGVIPRGRGRPPKAASQGHPLLGVLATLRAIELELGRHPASDRTAILAALSAK